MYHQPYYRNYPPNVTYNPYLHSSYQRNNPFAPVYDSAVPPRPYYQRPQPQYYGELSPQEAQLQQDRARALAERHARRAQYLPDEEDSVGSDEEWEYSQLGPRERAYVDARRRGEALERQRLEQEKARAEEAELARAREEEEIEMRKARQQELRKIQEERRRQFQQRQKEQQEMQERLARQRQQEWASSHGPKRASTNDNTVPINVRKAPPSQSDPHFASQRQPTQPQEPARPPTPKKFEPTVTYGSDHEDAAAKIQRQYRVHRSFKALSQYEKEFEELKKNFSYPCNIDFQKPGQDEGVVTVRALHPPSDYNLVEKEREEKAAMEAEDEDAMYEETTPTFEGKLAYTSTNFNLHQYSDAMDKLLMKLDGVESWGCKDVRERRRSIVKSIGREAARLDWYWKEAWQGYVREQSAKQRVETEEKEGTLPAQEQHEEGSFAVEMEPPEAITTASEPSIPDEPMEELEEVPQSPQREPMQQGEPEPQSTQQPEPAHLRLPIVKEPQPEPQLNKPRKIPITVSTSRMEN